MKNKPCAITKGGYNLDNIKLAKDLIEIFPKEIAQRVGVTLDICHMLTGLYFKDNLAFECKPLL